MGKSKRTKELQQRLNQNLLMRHFAGLQAIERQAELVRLEPTMPSQDDLVMPPWKADQGMPEEEFGRLKKELENLRDFREQRERAARGMTVQQWLDDQDRLQRTAYAGNFAGGDLAAKTGANWADTWMMNVTALVTELGEASNEVPWKPWSATRDRPTEEQRNLALKELVDAMHFMGNLFLLLGIDADDFARAWKHKQKVNADRQARGYDATAPGEKRDGRATDDDPAAELAGDIAAGLDRAGR